MYRSIYIPVDNSDYSNTAIDIGVMLAKQFGAKVIGSHAYAAKLHDKRFKQMEAGLPEEYHDENELERQRKIHDSLITRGLEIITDSYLDIVDQKCSESNVPLERRSLEGKNYKVLVDDIVQNGYDLVILGALGVGAVKESMIGSVTERTIRRVRKSDVFVVKETKPPVQGKMGKIVVAVDGSHYSFGGFKMALAMAKAYQLEVDVVSAFDPYYHYAVFNSISGVLNEEAGKVFRFKEQEKLHEEVIDSGLAKIYQSHLEVCQKIAETEGVKIKTSLLDGKPFEKVLQYVKKERPWLLVVGRIGVHSDEEMDVGSNSENLIRMAPCNVLVANQKYIPPIDAIAEYTVAWTEEASKRMEKVPVFARGVAKTAVYRYAIEKGFTIISNSVVDAAMGDILPKSAIEAMKNLGKVLDEKGIDRNKMTAADGVAETLGSGGIAGMMTQIVGTTADAERAAGYDEKAKLDFFICGGCGYTAKGDKPVKCPICSADGSVFQFLDKSLFESAAKAEGGLSQEVGYDGVPLNWTEEAKNILRKVPAGFERRRAKAKAEKMARKMGFKTLTKEFAVRMIEGGQYDDEEAIEMSAKAIAGAILPKTETAAPLPVVEEKKPEPKAPQFTWSEEAKARLERVPVGFMRDGTRQHIENYAFALPTSHITLEVAEAGIKKATEEMEAVLSGATSLEEIKKRIAKMTIGDDAVPGKETLHFCGMCGHVVKQVPEKCPVCEAKRSRFILMVEGTDYFICVICSQVAHKEIPDHCLLCGASGEYYKALERRESGLEKAFMPVTWTDAANAKLLEIPEGFMREMTRWRIEVGARKKGLREIDPAVIEAKYNEWAHASRKVERNLPWDAEAEARTSRIPSFVRGTVVKEIEAYAAEKGIGRITVEILDQVTERWVEAMRYQGF
ncbi:MAG TPA: universal stress protein [Candidatus Manganitrophaceae bacterium]|nr:universal stress protein [Candidatus Manganitrophaceae bacterium]